MLGRSMMERAARTIHRVGPPALFAVALVVGVLPSFAAAPIVGPDGRIPSLAPLLREVTPAVVNVATQSREAANPLFNDPLYRRFYNIPENSNSLERRGVGSGVIIDARAGYILTNNHLVDGADDIVVTLKDNRQLSAQLVGADPDTDVAILRVEAANLKAIALGDSDQLQVGDFVIAIGNPFGLGQTVTSGIVSALGRTGLGIENYENFIQTDASINPGNSGGALINLRGELVGINTAIVGATGGNVGIGFAVPINMARGVMQQLIAHGKVTRGHLGVEVRDLTPEIAQTLHTQVTGGAVINRVEPGSAALHAGLRSGDVIIAVDDIPVTSSSDLRNRVGLTPVGQRIRLTILRNGGQRTVDVTLGSTG